MSFFNGDIIVENSLSANSISATTAILSNIFSGSSTLATILSNVFETQRYYGYYSGNNVSITAGWTDVNIDCDLINDNLFFSHTGSSAEITILTAGTYNILGRITINNKNNNNNSTAEAKIQINTGGGYLDLPGSTGSMSLQGSNTINTKNSTIAISGVQYLPVNSKIKMQARRSEGTATLSFISGSTNIIIER